MAPLTNRSSNFPVRFASWPPLKPLQQPRMSHSNNEVRAALSWLEQKSTPHDLRNLTRFGITTNKAFGVSMSNIQVLGKKLGRNHELAAALWDTGWYEARMLTSYQPVSQR